MQFQRRSNHFSALTSHLRSCRFWKFLGGIFRALVSEQSADDENGCRPLSPISYFILRLSSITLTRTSVLYLTAALLTQFVPPLYSSPPLYTSHIVNFSIPRPPLVPALLPNRKTIHGYQINICWREKEEYSTTPNQVEKVQSIIISSCFMILI